MNTEIEFASPPFPFFGLGLTIFLLSCPIELALDWWFISAPMFYAGIVLMFIGIFRAEGRSK